LLVRHRRLLYLLFGRQDFGLDEFIPRLLPRVARVKREAQFELAPPDER